MVKEPILEYILITYMPDQKVPLYMEILRSIFRIWKMSRAADGENHDQGSETFRA
jgi:hypothetical protein